MINKSDQLGSKVFWFLASLKLAMIVLLGLAASLAAGTVVESLTDTPTAQFYVYRAPWFRSLLLLLGINILVVALSRWPWKKRHLPFLLAHLGILTLLFGSALTDRRGLDGTLRVSEGETSGAVDIDQPLLVISEGASVKTRPVPWVPPGARFSPLRLPENDFPGELTVDQFISHAEPEFHFLPASASDPEAAPAVKIRIQGGPMRISQEFWLWSGKPGWSAIQAGPAWLAFGAKGPMPPGRPTLLLNAEKNGDLTYETISSSGEKLGGRLAAGKIASQTLASKWKGGVTLSVEEFLPSANQLTNYKPSRTQYREMAPPSAIHLTAGKGGPGAEVWLGLGERAVLRPKSDPRREIEIGYFNRRVLLPFSVRLNRFKIERYEGSMNPSSYESQVTVMDANPQEVTISMNEPLEHSGFTVYQASYEDAMPRPVTSIFSINQDPGRPWKYGGSLLIVLGTILLFAVKYKNRKKTASPNAPEVLP